MELQKIIENLVHISETPAEQVRKWKAETGGKAIGCFPAYTPGELVYAAGMLPVGCWGGNVEISLAKSYIPAFCCSVMQQDLELGLRGSYGALDAVIVPSLCDTLKCIGQDLKVGVPKLRVIQFTYPQMRKLDAGVDFLVSEYGRVKQALEELGGAAITDAAIRDAISVFNENRYMLRRFTALAAEHTDVISPSVRHAVIKSGYFMEKPAHTRLVGELCDALEARSPCKEGKRVLVTGIMADDAALLTYMDRCGFAVAADDLAQETRQFRSDVPESGDGLRALAEWWRNFEGCSLACDPEKKRVPLLLDTAARQQAAGVIVCMMKFCDPEEYDFPFIKQALAEKGLPCLYLEIGEKADAQTETRIQAFSEIL